MLVTSFFFPFPTKFFDTSKTPAINEATFRSSSNTLNPDWSRILLLGKSFEDNNQPLDTEENLEVMCIENVAVIL